MPEQYNSEEDIVFSLKIDTGRTSGIPDEDGFQADHFVYGGELSFFPNLNGVYKTERWGKFMYRIPLPGPGIYKVIFHFIEPTSRFFHNGAKIFHVDINCLRSIKNLDVFAVAGASNPLKREVLVPAITDMLIVMSPVVSLPMLSALEIHYVSRFTDEHQEYVKFLHDNFGHCAFRGLKDLARSKHPADVRESFKAIDAIGKQIRQSGASTLFEHLAQQADVSRVYEQLLSSSPDTMKSRLPKEIPAKAPVDKFQHRGDQFVVGVTPNTDLHVTCDGGCQGYFNDLTVSETVIFMLAFSKRFNNLDKFLESVKLTVNYAEDLRREHQVGIKPEIYVAFYGSDEDHQKLIDKFKSYVQIPLRTIRLQGRFERVDSYIALVWEVQKRHKDPILFFVDIDMLMPKLMLPRLRRYCIKGKKIFSPVRADLNREPEIGAYHPNSPSMDSSWGMMAMYMSDYNRIGGFDPQLWGNWMEDTKMGYDLEKAGYIIFRRNFDDFFHQPHPSSDEVRF